MSGCCRECVSRPICALNPDVGEWNRENWEPLKPMNAFPFWIQRADFSSGDHPPADAAKAIRVFDTHDWPGELRLFVELNSAGKECCPPGIGFVAPNGGILHICPEQNGTALVHYHFAAQRKLLGLIPRATVTTVTADRVDRSRIVDLIGLFFEQHHETLVERLGPPR